MLELATLLAFTYAMPQPAFVRTNIISTTEYALFVNDTQIPPGSSIRTSPFTGKKTLYIRLHYVHYDRVVIRHFTKEIEAGGVYEIGFEINAPPPLETYTHLFTPNSIDFSYHKS